MTFEPHNRTASPPVSKKTPLARAVKLQVALATCATLAMPLSAQAGSVELSTLDGSDGFSLSGIDAGFATFATQFVKGLGDVNGDGFEDFIVGAEIASYATTLPEGVAYVVLGQAGGFPVALDLTSPINLTSNPRGFRIVGRLQDSNLGRSVASAGDVNGDGFDDIMVSAASSSSYDINPGVGADNDGIVSVMFGRETFTADVVQVSDLSGTEGFKLATGRVAEYAGFSISSAGDVNGDGADDLLIGSEQYTTSPQGNGAAFVVFGKLDPLPINGDTFDDLMILGGISPLEGVEFLGAAVGDAFGASVTSIGDIDGDGFDDFAIGAPLSNKNGVALPCGGPTVAGTAKGAAYIVFGGFPPNTSPRAITVAIDAGLAFKLEGEFFCDRAGAAISGAGDVDGDGVDDLIIGAPGGGQPGPVFDVLPAYSQNTGAAYVVLGGERSDIAGSLSGLSVASKGFQIYGEIDLGYTGFSVSGGGDVNGDDLDDVVIGAPKDGFDSASNLSSIITTGIPSEGAAYVVYGSLTPTDVSVSSLAGAGGMVLKNSADPRERLGQAVSLADINGDGAADILIARGLTDPYSSYSSSGIVTEETYAVFGGPSECGDVLLTANQWRMVSISCNPGASNSVADLMGNSLGRTDYGTTWVAWRWNPVASSYQKLALSDTLAGGEGVWLYSTVTSQVAIDSPTAGMLPDSFEHVLTGPDTWNLIGNPYNQPLSLTAAGVAINHLWSSGEFSSTGVFTAGYLEGWGNLFSNGLTAIFNYLAFPDDESIIAKVAYVYTGAGYESRSYSAPPGVSDVISPAEAFWLKTGDYTAAGPANAGATIVTAFIRFYQ